MTSGIKRPPKAVLARLCQQNKSQREIALIFHASTSSAAHWLNHYGLKTKWKAGKSAVRKPKCKICGDTAPKNFDYGRKARCKKCRVKQQQRLRTPRRRSRRHMLKYAAVQAKGGCCQRCGYRKNLAALQFHHPDRQLKYEGWNRLFFQTTQSAKHVKTLAAQLEHCELLCANCHAEEHHPHTEMPMCVTGPNLIYLSQWVSDLKHLFHTAAT